MGWLSAPRQSLPQCLGGFPEEHQQFGDSFHHYLMLISLPTNQVDPRVGISQQGSRHQHKASVLLPHAAADKAWPGLCKGLSVMCFYGISMLCWKRQIVTCKGRGPRHQEEGWGEDPKLQAAVRGTRAHASPGTVKAP